MAAMVDDLFRNRPQWSARAAVGKTVVSSSMIDRVAARLDRKLYETPVGFKWFADGLFDGSLGLGGEESAGASFLRRDGTVWTTDKDGMAPALFAAELTARHGHDPAEHYRGLCDAFGEVFFDRVEAPRSEEHTSELAKLSTGQLKADKHAGPQIREVLHKAPGNDAPIGGLKVVADSGRVAPSPPGPENIPQIHGQSYR